MIGLSLIALSSLDFLFSGSRNLGDGDKAGGPPSDNERAFEVDLDVPFLSGVLAPSCLAVSASAAGSRRLSCSWLLNIVRKYKCV